MVVPHCSGGGATPVGGVLGWRGGGWLLSLTGWGGGDWVVGGGVRWYWVVITGGRGGGGVQRGYWVVVAKGGGVLQLGYWVVGLVVVSVVGWGEGGEDGGPKWLLVRGGWVVSSILQFYSTVGEP